MTAERGQQWAVFSYATAVCIAHIFFGVPIVNAALVIGISVVCVIGLLMFVGMFFVS